MYHNRAFYTSSAVSRFPSFISFYPVMCTLPGFFSCILRSTLTVFFQSSKVFFSLTCLLALILTVSLGFFLINLLLEIQITMDGYFSNKLKKKILCVG